MDRVDSARDAEWTPPATATAVTSAAGASTGTRAGTRAGTAVRRSVTLPPDAASPARARHLLREVLEAARRPDCLDAAELACTELVTNAVLHAHTAIDVTVEVGDVVRVEVRDGSPALPGRRHYDPHATTGRGLALVAALSDDHGVADAGTTGKTMWFTVGHAPLERSGDELAAVWDAADWDLELPVREPVRPPATRTVHLLSMPSALWLAARQHHDALLRELALYTAWHDDVVVDLAATDRARFVISGAVAAAVDRQREAWAGRHAAGTVPPWRPVPVDLDLHVPDDAGPDFLTMQDTLEVAERLARAGHLLARPGLPEIVAVRDWACDQVVAQLAGVAPSAWPGTDQERFIRPVDLGAGGGLEGVDLDAVRSADGCVAAADDSNRLVAVSPALARLVGSPADELVGRRIAVLIPHRFREAHVAGFSRHLSTGEEHVIGVPITVPVLRADGSEVPCVLLIQRSAVADGRALYLATLTPVQEPGPEPEPAGADRPVAGGTR